MDLMLKDKGAVVFASSAGLGRGCATELAREGARVLLVARDEGRLAAARTAIGEETGNAPEVFCGDVSRPQDIEAAINAAVESFGNLYSVVCNAGGPPAGPFEKFSDEEWAAAFNLTLMSVVRSVRAALPHFRAGGGGRVVTIASSSTRQALPNLLLSNVFRMGIVGLTKTLAKEHGHENILTNVLCPGRFDTDRVAQLDALMGEKADASPAAVRQREEGAIPVGRYGDPAEFGKVAAFLCSPANTYTTGQTLIVDGGLVSAY